MTNSAEEMYLFTDKIDFSFAYDFLKSFLFKVRKLPENKKMHIYVAGNGGEVGAALSLVDQMVLYRNKIITHCVGGVSSASIYPYLIGVERYAYDFSFCVVHPISFEFELGNPRESQERTNILTKLDLLDQKLVRSLAPKFWEWYNAHRTGEYILIGQEMEKHGMATHYIASLNGETVA